MIASTSASLGCSTAQSSTPPSYVAPPIVNRSQASVELSANPVTDGSIVIVRVLVPQKLNEDQITGEFEGVELPFYQVPSKKPFIYEAVLGVPYGRKPGSGFVSVKLNLEKTKGSEPDVLVLPLEVKEGTYESETLSADNKFINPSVEDQERMKRDSAEIKEIYGTVTRKKHWKGPFRFPIKSKVTSQFGTKRVFNGEMKSFHTGLDLKAAEGTPIRAAAPGVVLMAKNLFMTGNTVILDHGYGVLTLYAHMTRIKVKKGQGVKKGALLGLSGMTGRVSGPHLHWMAIVHRMKVNPLDLTRVVK